MNGFAMRHSESASESCIEVFGDDACDVSLRLRGEDDAPRDRGRRAQEGDGVRGRLVCPRRGARRAAARDGRDEFEDTGELEGLGYLGDLDDLDGLGDIGGLGDLEDWGCLVCPYDFGDLVGDGPAGDDPAGDDGAARGDDPSRGAGLTDGDGAAREGDPAGPSGLTGLAGGQVWEEVERDVPLTPRELGRFGEDLAARCLRLQGYAILERNWRCSCGEVDIVACDGGETVLVEVKTRRGEDAVPEEAVDPRKQERYRRLCLRYLTEHDHVDRLRMDVVAVNVGCMGRIVVRHTIGACSWDG